MQDAKSRNGFGPHLFFCLMARYGTQHMHDIHIREYEVPEIENIKRL